MAPNPAGTGWRGFSLSGAWQPLLLRMNVIRAFSCDDANAYLIIGLLLGGFIGEVVYLSGARTRIRRFWFLAGTVIGVFAGSTSYWLMNGRCL